MSATLFVVLIGTHWGTFEHIRDRWAHDPQYSHGFIVPLFALIVLWSRRETLKRLAWQPACIDWALLALGVMMRVVAAESDFEPLDSLLPIAFGSVLLVGDCSVLRCSWPALAFLALMMPLPFAVEDGPGGAAPSPPHDGKHLFAAYLPIIDPAIPGPRVVIAHNVDTI
ncbi:MAG: exosortase/archaeosortase family protein [Gemmataceae bacterium]|nr:exosortase/archaeosortase family protein [Gemmataceae bacterium]